MADIRVRIKERMMKEDNGGIDCIIKIVSEEMEKDELWRFDGNDKSQYRSDFNMLFDYAIKCTL